MDKPEHFLETCLFFNANALSRNLLKLAEKQFKPLKLSPAHASLMLVVYDQPGISPKKISDILQLSPSTISRFVEALAKKNLLTREHHGKTTQVYPAPDGLALKPEIARAYRRFCMEYLRILTPEHTEMLSGTIRDAGKKLSNAFLPK